MALHRNSVGRNIWYIRSFFIGILTFVLSVTAAISWAHPHVFIYSNIVVVFNEKGLTGFKIRWSFDEMFSNMIILDFDKNGNHRFETPEIESIKKSAFSNLHKFDYFTHLKIDGKPFKLNHVTDFSAKIIEDKLVYEFFAPCHVRAIDVSKEVKLSIYDSTFYSSVFLEKNPVAFESHQLYEVEHQIERNKKEAYYYGQIYPEEITLRFKLKNG